MRKHNPDRDPLPLDRVIASMPSPESMPPRLTNSAAKLVPHAPIRRVRPNHLRERDALNPELRLQFRNLANGLDPWPLYLWSPGPGTGKTSAGLAMLDHYGDVRGDCSGDLGEFLNGFVDFAALPDLFRQAERGRLLRAGGSSVQPSDLWAATRSAKLVVVDDVRRPGEREQRLGDDHYSVLKRVLDLRVGLPLIITSNIDPWERHGRESELVRLFDDRIADRILSGTVFGLTGPTRRSE